ncbi:MAG: hypothetical protein QM692_17485, partial [Thermomicrobiales bacterium]
DDLVQALERKINPWVLVQITLMTIAITWGLVVWTAMAIKQLITLPVARVDFLLLYPDGLPRRAAAWLLSQIDKIPDDIPIILYTGIPIIAVVTAIAVLTALRQRIRLEDAWNTPYQTATGWRNAASRALQADVRSVEQALSRANLSAAETMIAGRRARLTAFERLGYTPLTAPPEADEAITGILRPGSWSPRPLSDLQVAQIVAAFKQRCAHIDSAQWAPEYLLQELFAEAAMQAGDPPLDLRQELAPVRRRVLRAMPPDGAVRVQQLPTTSPAERALPTVSRFLAAPAAVVGDLRFEPHVAVVMPLPIDTRFYTAIVQSGMSARRILSRSTPWDSDPLNPATAPEPEPTPEAEPDPIVEPTPEPEPAPADEPAPEPAPEPEPEPKTEPDPAPEDGPAPETPETPETPEPPSPDRAPPAASA